MRSIRLVIALLRVPRLFLTLIFFPLLISLVVIYMQLLVTSLFTKALSRNSAETKTRLAESSQHNLVRQILFGSSKPLPPPRVCRWRFVKENGGLIEMPPEPACNPDRLDAAIQVADPAAYDPSEYVDLLNGNFERLHLCRSCQPDMVIHADKGSAHTDIYSVWAFALLALAQGENGIAASRINLLRENEAILERFGERILHLPGFRAAISLDNLAALLMFIINLAFLVIVALWLSLKAHRRVLDYFARNGALLPLVAACGKRSFYTAIWIITCARVGAFLAGAVPAVAYCTVKFTPQKELTAVFGKELLELALWLIALIASLALSGIIGSIADLKHRHHILSFTYRFVPLVFCAAGSLAWMLTLLIEGSTVEAFRNIIASLPIAGLTPVLMAPVFKPDINVLAMHALAAALLFSIMLKKNADWFAAHLEEL
jgi:hypothetical protein